VTSDFQSHTGFSILGHNSSLAEQANKKSIIIIIEFCYSVFKILERYLKVPNVSFNSFATVFLGYL
jgi:hypothetical protein